MLPFSAATEPCLQHGYGQGHGGWMTRGLCVQALMYEASMQTGKAR